MTTTRTRRQRLTFDIPPDFDARDSAILATRLAAVYAATVNRLARPNNVVQLRKAI